VSAPPCVVCGELLEPGEECRQTTEGVRHCPGRCPHSNVLMVAGLNAIERQLEEVRTLLLEIRGRLP